jgi:hypothetical protein
MTPHCFGLLSAEIRRRFTDADDCFQLGEFMTARPFFAGAMLLAIVSLSHAQGGFFFFSDAYPLTDACKGGKPLPDGTPVYVYNDTNANGPDDADPLAQICSKPPNCESGPGGTVNFNRFAINGDAAMKLPGCFAVDPLFISATAMPESPLFYLRAMYAETLRTDSGVVERKITWTSAVQTMVKGAPEDVDLGNAKLWTCENSARLMKK